MKRALRRGASAAAMAACAIACSSEVKESHWTRLPWPFVGTVWALQFLPDNTPIVVGDDGIFRYDGSAFVALSPPIPAGARPGSLSIGSDGAIYVGTMRLRPGAAAWDDLRLPVEPTGPAITVTPGPGGSLVTFAYTTANSDPTKDKGTLFHRTAEGPWTALGEIAAPSVVLADNRGFWIESGGRLYTVRDGVLRYVMQSTGLSFVRDDGTLIYLFDNYTNSAAVARNEAGEETVLSLGYCDTSCPDDAVGQRGVFAVGTAMTPAGRLYIGWKGQNLIGRPITMMALDPGAFYWRVAAREALPATAVVPDRKERLWAYYNQQVGGFDPTGKAGTDNRLYSYLYRLDE